MKRIGVIAAMVAGSLLMSAGTGRAAGFAIFGSYLSPADSDEMLGFGMRLTWIVNDHWDLDLTASSYDGDAAIAAIPAAGGLLPDRISNIDVVPMDLGVRYRFGEGRRFHPYFGVGASWAQLRSEIGELDDEIGYYALLGAELGDEIGPRFFVDVTYRNLDGSIKRRGGSVSYQEAIDLSGPGINAGITWRWR